MAWNRNSTLEGEKWIDNSIHGAECGIVLSLNKVSSLVSDMINRN